jgi:hypothetical protein
VARCVLTSLAADYSERRLYLVQAHMLAWICVVLAAVALLADAVIDGRKSLVWGPAIDSPELDLPVRYLFVQLVDEDGHK